MNNFRAEKFENCPLHGKIILAAYWQLHCEGELEFTKEDIAVAAWKTFPALCMKGYPDHPSENRVFCTLDGKKGLVRGRKWLERIEDYTLSFTQEGLKVARSLVDQYDADELSEAPTRSCMSEISWFTDLFDRSMVVQRRREGEFQHFTFQDACSFWGFPRNDGMHGEKIDKIIKLFDANLAALRKEFGSQDGIKVNGRFIAADEVKMIDDLHVHFQKKFLRHLELLRNRR